MVRPPEMSSFKLLLLAASFAPSLASQISTLTPEQVLGVLERRDSSCGNKTFVQCPFANLPDNFCCPAKSSCITLDSGSTALCCPEGADCSSIQPIICDVTQQNITAHPETSIMTSNFDVDLLKCGTNTCCPLGYNCKDNLCVINTATSSLSNQTSTATSTSKPTTSMAPTATSSSAASAKTSDPSLAGIDSASHVGGSCDTFPTQAVLVGFFPGMIAGALLCLLAVLCLGRQSTERPISSSTNASFQKYSHFRGRSADGAIIGVSDPIPHEQATRTDFLRREPPPPPPPALSPARSRIQRTQSRVKSWFAPRNTVMSTGSSHYPMTSSSRYPSYIPDHYNATPPIPPIPPIPTTPPSQKKQNLKHEPSTESIKIYTPPSMLRRNTDDNGRSPPKAGTGFANLPYSIPPPPPIPQSLGPAHTGDKRTTTFTDIMERSGFEPGLPGTKYNGL